MDLVTLTIDGQQVQIEKGATVLEAAQKIGVKIPTLCYHPELSKEGACRVCVVEVKGQRSLVASCVFPVSEGMVVNTNTPAVREARKTVVELLLANHPADCLQCVRSGNCELQTLANNLGIREVPFEGEKRNLPLDTSSPSIVRDPNKCILCGRCIKACGEVQGVNALSFTNRGFNTVVVPPFNKGLADATCVNCGQCIQVCPVGAIYEVDNTKEVWEAIADPGKHVIVQTAPAVRVAIGEALGMEEGALVTGKMVAALRRLGFDKVFDTNFAADLTILEEGNELLHRLQNGGPLPLLTSCSPGWIKFCEHFYPEFLPNLSTCKSPQQMFGAVAKTYYAQKTGIDPKDIVCVSIMPCTAKKFEAQRPEMNDSGYQDVDYVLTTRELARMIKEAGIEFDKLPEEQFDSPLGTGTGAAVIFGATGGVMEAALRTVYEVVTKETLPKVEFEDVRGLEGIKEASVNLNGTEVKVAVAHGLGNARKLLEKVKAGEANYHFIEVMGCPGGCIGGGGQPQPTYTATRLKRLASIYKEDAGLPLRKSHENPDVQALYEEFLVKPLGEKSHHLLHTKYTPRPKY